VRQRLTSREHSPVRQYVFSSCLSRSSETVPEIDQAYQCGEVDQLLILEVPADFGVGRIGLQSFGPRQASPLALGVEG
jgi:hypothetical protein